MWFCFQPGRVPTSSILLDEPVASDLLVHYRAHHSTNIFEQASQVISTPACRKGANPVSFCACLLHSMTFLADEPVASGVRRLHSPLPMGGVYIESHTPDIIMHVHPSSLHHPQTFRISFQAAVFSLRWTRCRSVSQ